jgi:hypothetical protein
MEEDNIKRNNWKSNKILEIELSIDIIKIDVKYWAIIIIKILYNLITENILINL